MDIMAFIADNMTIVVAVLFILGLFLKAVPRIPDWTIPFALCLVGMGLGTVITGLPEGLMQGVLCAGGAVLVHQCLKQAALAIEDKHPQQKE